jgi:hypothetical protein
MRRPWVSALPGLGCRGRTHELHGLVHHTRPEEDLGCAAALLSRDRLPELLGLLRSPNVPKPSLTQIAQRPVNFTDSHVAVGVHHRRDLTSLAGHDLTYTLSYSASRGPTSDLFLRSRSRPAVPPRVRRATTARTSPSQPGGSPGRRNSCCLRGRYQGLRLAALLDRHGACRPGPACATWSGQAGWYAIHRQGSCEDCRPAAAKLRS